MTATMIHLVSLAKVVAGLKKEATLLTDVSVARLKELVERREGAKKESKLSRNLKLQSRNGLRQFLSAEMALGIHDS